MKFTKLSLAALVAMGIASSASAVENVKVDGSIKLWYQTTDSKASTGAVTAADGVATSETDGLFKKDGATGDLVAKLRATGDLTKKVGFGFTMYAATTLGLENNLVNNEAINNASSSAGNSGLNGTDKNPVWLGEAYFTYKMGKTIAKIGRQELDTPLAYTETWNAAPNTFEAAVLINQDIPDTTLIAAYVSRGNGYDNGFAVNNSASVAGVNAKTVTTNGQFYNYHANSGVETSDSGGAYAAGMVNKSIPNLTIHPVYYNVLDTATAFWGDLTYNVPKIVKIEALYANVDPTGATQKLLDTLAASAQTKSTSAYAAQVSGEVVGIKLAGAYSSVGKGFLPVANTATGFKKTKIYTASILSDGTVAGRPDTTGWKLSAGYDIAGFGLSASYGSYKVGNNDGKANWFNTANALGLKTSATATSAVGAVGGTAGVEYKPSEIDLAVTTKIDEVSLALYYVNVKEASKNAVGTTTDVQAIRAIATINF